MALRILHVVIVGASLTGVCGFAQAADCPPIGSLPGYVASPQLETRAYNAVDFNMKKGDDTATVKVAGRTCIQSYAPKSGADPMSDLEIQKNYRDQLKKLGAEVFFTDDRDTEARVVRGTQETWIKIYSQETEIDVSVVDKVPFKQTLLPPSGNDYRLLGHMPNYVSDKPEKRNFDKDTFTVQNGDDSHDIEVQGAKFTVAYAQKQGAPLNSDLEIQENYRAALAALGAQMLFTDGSDTVARLDENGRSIWIKVHSQETEIDVATIEEKPFQASIKPPEASAMKAALDKDGHIALYVNFDFNKATLKPDAAPVIGQVVKLLKDNPSLRLDVDGYTDNIGTRDYNVKLSGSRAAAVVAAITAQGIAANRLHSAGFGPDKPVADNAKEEGRAKNRRVELVKS
ncbi:MAG: OmpA family protein [Proteobacteria bacterium]|nr:OmpA family protein [Pseudomonadota bacterium]